MAFKNLSDISSLARNVYDFSYEQKAWVRVVDPFFSDQN